MNSSFTTLARGFLSVRLVWNYHRVCTRSAQRAELPWRTSLLCRAHSPRSALKPQLCPAAQLNQRASAGLWSFPASGATVLLSASEFSSFFKKKFKISRITSSSVLPSCFNYPAVSVAVRSIFLLVVGKMYLTK